MVEFKFVILVYKILELVPIKDILQPNKHFKVSGMLRIESEDERFFGPGRLQLLENIIQTGSISQAAKEMGMSYKKAWDMIHSMNRQTVQPIVETHAGGEKGGGTLVTEEGKLLIAAFKKMNEEVRQLLEEKLQAFLDS